MQFNAKTTLTKWGTERKTAPYVQKPHDSDGRRIKADSELKLLRVTGELGYGGKTILIILTKFKKLESEMITVLKTSFSQGKLRQLEMPNLNEIPFLQEVSLKAIKFQCNSWEAAWFEVFLAAFSWNSSAVLPTAHHSYQKDSFIDSSLLWVTALHPALLQLLQIPSRTADSSKGLI